METGKVKSVAIAVVSMFAGTMAADQIFNPGAGASVSPEKISGTQNVTVQSGFVTLDPANDYSGTTTIDGGTVIAGRLAPVGTASSLGRDGTIVIGKGVLRYTGTEAVTIDRSFSNPSPITGTTYEDAGITIGDQQILDIKGDVTFTKPYLAGCLGFIKRGPGTLIFRDSMKALVNASEKSMGVKYPSSLRSKTGRTVFASDGGTLAVGAGLCGFFEGRTEFHATGTVGQDDGFLPVGGWTADNGEVEKDVEVVIGSGETANKVTWAATTLLGQMHGFRDFNTPNGPAKATLRIRNKATFQQAGGKSFYLGSADGKTGNVFNSDLRLILEPGGTWDHSNSGAGLLVPQRMGQPTWIDVDGGTMIETLVKLGEGASANDTTATIEIDVHNGGVLKGEQFQNVASKAACPPVTVKVRGGSSFLYDEVSNNAGGTLNFEFDEATLGNLNFVWKLCDSANVGPTRREILPATVTSATIGRGGLTLYAQDNGGYLRSGGYTRSLGQRIVIGKGLASAAGLADGETDGGVTVTAQNATNVIELAGANTYTGPTVVKSGTLTLSGEGVIPAALTLESGATLWAETKDITLADATFKAGAILKVTQGRKIIVTGALTLEEGVDICVVNENGEPISASVENLDFLQVPVGQKSKLSTLMLNGFFNAKLAFSNVLYREADGTCTVSLSLVPRTDNSTAAASSATWTGAGADDALTTAENWEGAVAPAFDGGLNATFVEENGTAVISGEKAFRGLVFNTSDFTLGKVGDFDFLYLGNAGLSFATSREAQPGRVTFAVPVESDVPQVWTVPASNEVVFADSLRLAAGVTVSGEGQVALMGSKTVLGNAQFMNKNGSVVFSGYIANVGGGISSASDLSDPGMIAVVGQTKAQSAAGIDRNVLSNAVIHKAIRANMGGESDYQGQRLFTAVAGTTNVIRGFVTTSTPMARIFVDKNAELVFAGGVKFGWSMEFSGSGRTVVRDNPISFAGGRPLVEKGATLRFEVAGNSYNERLTMDGTGSVVEYAVDDVFLVTKTGYLDLTQSVASTNDLMATTQHFPRILSNNDKVVVTGADGARLVITEGVASGAENYGTTNICCQVDGGVSLVMEGEGDLVLAQRTFRSCGDLTVKNGRIRLENGAQWCVGTNVTACGSGQIVFTAPNQLARHAKLHFLDTGSIVIPENTTLRVAEADVGGQDVGNGVYTASSTGPLAHRIGGPGRLVVGKVGMCVIFR